MPQFLPPDHLTPPQTPLAGDRAAVEGASLAPLSAMQQRLWFMETLLTGRSTYHLAAARRIEGPLDVAALATAMNALARRHPSLRTVFRTDTDGLPHQVALAPAALTHQLPTLELTAFTGEAQQRRLQAELARLVTCPLDLHQGPLFVWTLLKLGERDHMLFFKLHHLIGDGTSMVRMLDELEPLYAAARSGAEATLPELPLSYSQFVEWHAEWLRSDTAQAQVAYWTQRLDPPPEPLALPADRPRPPEVSNRAGSVPLSISAPVGEGLRRIAATEDATLFAALLSAYFIFLNQHTGQTDLAVGIPVHGRGLRRDLRGLVGLFANTLAFRMELQPDWTFRELIRQIRPRLQRDLSHADAPFEQIVQRLRLPHDTSRFPVYQAFMGFQDLRKVRYDWQDLRLQPQVLPQAGIAEDIACWLIERSYGLTGTLAYSADLFSESTGHAMARRFEALLQRLVESPDTSVHTLAAATDDDRLLPQQWNAASHRPPLPAAPRTVHAMVRTQALRTPEGIALVGPDGAELTHGGLDALANRIARTLRSHGIGRGKRVALCLERSTRMVAAQLAVLKSGAAYVPLDPTYPAARLTDMADDAELSLLITDSQSAHALPWPRAKSLWLDTDMDTAAPVAPTEPPPEPDAALDARPEDAAYVIYTSGSTGRPKGVVVPHRSVVNFLGAMAHTPGLSATDTLVAVTTLSFDIAVLELLLPLTVGARVVIASADEARDGRALSRRLQSTGATAMQATPSTWRLLIEAAWPGASGFKALVGGEPLPADLVAPLAARSGELWNLYGPTETTVWSTCWRVDPKRPRIAIGRPIDNTQIHVLDTHGRPCPVGLPGEIFIGGNGVALGYWRRPELTAERFVRDPFAPGGTLYRTGDRGRWCHDGLLEHLGRLDHQVKLRGYRIELGDVESALSTHSNVRQAVAAVLEPTPGDARLVAWVAVGDPGPSAAESSQRVRDLQAHLRQLLPPFMQPQHIVPMTALPLLPNGKIDRSALPRPTQENVGSPNAWTHATASSPLATDSGEPLSGTPQLIAQAFAEVLGLAEVRGDANFFELGGHSLQATRLALRLGTLLNREVDLRTLFRHPVPLLLAQALAATPTPEPETTRRTGPSIHDAHEGPAGDTPALEAFSTATRRLVPRPGERHAPLSPMQQRLWFLEDMHPGQGFHQLPMAYRLRGELNAPALQRAFQRLVARQSALRTVIERTPQGLRQTLRDDLPIDWPTEDLPRPKSQPPRFPRDTALQERLRALSQEAIDTEQGPLFRIRLLKLADDEHVLFFMVHHFIWDGASFEILLNELATLYRAEANGDQAELPLLPVTYGDFAAWQTQWLQGDELASQTAQYGQRFTPLPEPLALPTDRPRPLRASGHGQSCALEIPTELTEALRAQARTQGCTLAALLLAAFSTQLMHLSGQHDLVIALPVQGREQPELASLMGFFVNALPLRLQPADTDAFDKWTARVQAVIGEAMAHRQVPFEHLVQSLKLPRDASRAPLAQALFSFRDGQDRPADWGGLELSVMSVPLQSAQHDVALYIVDTATGLHCALVYNTDVFEETGMRLFLRSFEQLLKQAVSDRTRRLIDFELLTDAERRRLDDWNATRTSVDATACVHHLISKQARATPNAPAVREPGGEALSHAQLEARSNRLAHTLRARGVGRGARVGLCLERGTAMVVAVLASLKAGAAYVPLDPGYPAGRLAHMADDAQLSLLVTESACVHAIEWPRDTSLLLDIDAQAIEAQPDAPLPFDDALDARSTDPAYVIYTSGSTGLPKGVVVPHGAVVNFLGSMARQPGMDPDDKVLAITTLSFDIAVLELLLPLCVGAETLIAPRDALADARALRTLLESSGATVMQATPSTWRLLIETGWQGSTSSALLRKALVGGEPLPPDLAGALLERSGELWNLYGPTETTIWSTCWRVEPNAVSISIGRPIANTQAHVLDGLLRPCPLGVPGELFIGGIGVASGYLNRPQLSAERFIADPFRNGGVLYRTGDRARWRHDGLLEHLGRMDNQVKVRGHRIEPGEIESLLNQHPGISRSVVTVREDTPGDVRLVAYAVPRADLAPDTAAWRDHLRSHLPQAMIPQHIVALQSLPLLPNGKLDRQALPPPSGSEAFQAGNTHGSDPVAPRTPTEQAVAQVWLSLLGVERLSVTDNFFDLGGHSLLAMRAVIAIEAATGLRIPVRRLIFENLAQIARTDTEDDALALAVAPADSTHSHRRWWQRLKPTTRGTPPPETRGRKKGR